MRSTVFIVVLCQSKIKWGKTRSTKRQHDLEEVSQTQLEETHQVKRKNSDRNMDAINKRFKVSVGAGINLED